MPVAVFALYAAWYNFCRVHEALRIHGNSAVWERDGGPWTRLAADMAFTLIGRL
jgi:hypothetical protein